MTAGELAKLAALLAVPLTLPVEAMPKLELMQLPTDGIPQLTAEEREKRASELADPQIIAPASRATTVGSSASPGVTSPTPGN
jgi:hypothetical protein